MSHRPSRVASILTALALTLAPGCAPPRAGVRAAPPPTRCAGYDYGSGMVAVRFTPAAAEGLAAVHALIAADDALLSHSPLAKLPYQPHLSIIYGVTPDNTAAIAAAAQRWAEDTASLPFTLDSLIYWDDATGEKTTLAAQVGAAAQDAFVSLHAALSDVAGHPPRQPFVPHVTLAFLAGGMRLPAATEREVLARLAALHPAATTLIVTDACGAVRELMMLH